MLESVAGPINTWPFAIPETEYSLYRGAGFRFDLLRSNEGGRREIFVNRWLEVDVAGFEFRAAPP
ncbi:hypothetical protein EME01_56840 [Sinorhizobium meliloti]|nr:hypothetical protein EME01_56840 [Sinorhizobium meliloti]